jgi:hypothetical protein
LHFLEAAAAAAAAWLAPDPLHVLAGWLLLLGVQVRKNRYVILPKDFEKGYKANVKKSGDEFAFYQ